LRYSQLDAEGLDLFGRIRATHTRVRAKTTQPIIILIGPGHLHEDLLALISSSQKPRRDTRLIELCSLSRQHIAAMANTSCQALEEHDDELSLISRWCETVEVISRTQALTYAGIKAKTKVCYDVMTKLKTHNDIEANLMRSLFRDILAA
jgi:hypothetical protein